MKWSRNLSGHPEPFLKDLPVYDASALVKGELLMKGTTDPDSGGDYGLSLVTAYSATAANTAIDAVGVLQEDISSFTSTWVAVNSADYGKVTINPDAIFEAEASQAAADDQAITSVSSTTLTVASLSDDIDGHFVYFPLTNTGVKGSLRSLVASASGSATMAAALNGTADTNDTIIIIVPPLKYANNLNAAATKTASGDAQGISGATNLRVLEWSLKSSNLNANPIDWAEHNTLNGLDVHNVKFFNEIIMKDHLFGTQE